MLRLLRVVAGGVSLMAMAGLCLADTLYYRYPDTSGNVVIDSKVPPEAIPRGYDVIRVDGSVVKTVPPQLSQTEQKELAEEQAIAAARAAAEEKLRKWDESLLLRYSDPADVDVAKQRALHTLKVRISILRSNLAVLRRQVTQNQQNAAEMEREGREVPQQLVDTLRDLRREISNMEQQIVQRSAESEQVEQDYERDKQRFLVLQGQLRKQRGY